MDEVAGDATGKESWGWHLTDAEAHSTAPETVKFNSGAESYSTLKIQAVFVKRFVFLIRL